MKFLFFMTIILFSGWQNLNSAVFNSIKNGNWSDANTWDQSKIPSNNDEVYISHNVTLTANLNDKLQLTINESGSLSGETFDLKIKNGASLNVKGTLIIDNMEFENGSAVLVESTGSVEVNGNFTNKNNSSNIVIDSDFHVKGNFDNGTGGLIVGDGTISVDHAYTGQGSTFGFDPTSSIPYGATIRMGQILPVELISFKAEIKDNQVELYWVTGSEKNNNFFTIERSDNSIDFYEIGEIEGAGNSNVMRSYSFIDQNLPQSTVYYILKQTDFDGKWEYSSIISFNNVIIPQNNCEFVVNPNPCIGRCQIQFTNCESEELQQVSFSIFDAMGNTVYSSLPKHIEAGQASFTFDVNNNLKPAVYIVRGNNVRTKSDKKVIIE